jgi:DNA-directed RNA polymerase specialized sigma24 family protein
MTAKERAEKAKKYLKQIEKLDKRLARELRNLDKLRSSAEYRSPRFDSAGGFGSGDRLSESVSRIIEREERVQQLTDTYTKKYVEIEQAIRSVGDDNQEEVLELRYLHYKKWEEIASIMKYSLENVYKLHGKALQKITLNYSNQL